MRTINYLRVIDCTNDAAKYNEELQDRPPKQQEKIHVGLHINQLTKPLNKHKVICEQRLYINLCTQMKIIFTGLPMYGYWPGNVFMYVRGIEVCVCARMMCVCSCGVCACGVCVWSVCACGVECVCVWSGVCVRVEWSVCACGVCVRVVCVCVWCVCACGVCACVWCILLPYSTHVLRLSPYNSKFKTRKLH